MVSTGPAARIPAEAPNHADVPSGTRGIRAKAYRVCRASFLFALSDSSLNRPGMCSTSLDDSSGDSTRRLTALRWFDDDYLTSESMRNIGRYIAITMTPTMQPTRIIISGSMIEVSDWIAASTSSS
jgi:hypothetical protein